VGHAIQDIRDLLLRKERALVLDVGCGTGCIGIALLHAFPQGTVQVVAIDVSPHAVQLAKDNADLVLGPKCSYYQVVLDSAQCFQTHQSFDIVVSNPPYIPLPDMRLLTPDVSQYEDSNALCGGHDGMDVIRQLIQRSHHWIKGTGMLWIEVDCSHPQKILHYVQHSIPSTHVQFLKSVPDLYGNDRFVKLKIR